MIDFGMVSQKVHLFLQKAIPLHGLFRFGPDAIRILTSLKDKPDSLLKSFFKQNWGGVKACERNFLGGYHQCEQNANRRGEGVKNLDFLRT